MTTDLEHLLRSMEPMQVDGEFVYVSLAVAAAAPPAMAMVRETEGVTYVVARADADRLGLPYEYVAAWITLQVHSSLDAVGLTAAISSAIADAGISCNVLAGQFHDHLLVPHDRALEVLGVLRSLTLRY